MKRDDATGDLFAKVAPSRRAPEPEPAPPKPAPKLESVAATVTEIIRLTGQAWCKGCSARDAAGRPVPPDFARELSAYGAFALLRHQGRVPERVAFDVWRALNASTKPLPFARWHDKPERTLAQVLGRLREIVETENARTVPARGGV